jgi:hypothetical protein
MKKFPYFVSVVLLAVAAFGGASPSAGQQPVVVELFTSEGCSSCPPADAILSSLARQRTAVKGIDLILLGEHVEYWNGQGWNDRFSASNYTQRQYDYVRHLHLATAYTPQIVIDGHLQTSGGNRNEVQTYIVEEARSPKPATVSLSFVAPDKLRITVTDTSAGRREVLLAVTEDNLSTTVKGGENGGRVLKHDAVVRELHALGDVSNGTFDKTVTLPHKSDWKQADLRAVVLVQDAGSGVIDGAASVPFEAANTTAKGR